MPSDPQFILVYGTDWCPDCIRLLRYLEANKIEYQWLNINKDASACEIVEGINHGNQSVPTIIWPDGSYLVEPSIKQLKDKLELSNNKT